MMNKTPSAISSAYIHIPFCEHICYYCDFNKVLIKEQPVDRYLESLLKEIELVTGNVSCELETLYIGGGTPSALSSKQLDYLLSGILKQFTFSNTIEFTVEANPGDLTPEKIQIMKNYGVNRLSMGVQSFDNQILKKIGRKHTVKEIYQAIQRLEKANFNNISIDLIYALPGQTLENFKESLCKAIELNLPHYALYSLILENQTMFMNLARQGKIHFPSEDIEVSMLKSAIQLMEEAGRRHYEISNFAIPGKESRHNTRYWDNEHYYGFGAGASGYIDNLRYKNHGPIQHYLMPLEDNQLPIIEREELLTKHQIEEEMFLGLRMKKGVSKEKFYQKFGVSMESIYGETIQQLKIRKLIYEQTNSIALTSEGIFLGNEVFEAFLLD